MKIYFVPFLLDFILFMVQLRLSDASGREMRLSNAQATSLLVAFNLAYFVVCPFVGRALNARTTRPILLFSIAAILLLGVPLLWTTSWLPALILMSGLGASAALAFNSFQSLMRGRSPEGALSATVAKYNVSWSLGIGSGFLLGGILKSLGQPIWLSALCGLAVAAIWWMIWSESAPPIGDDAASSTRFARDGTKRDTNERDTNERDTNERDANAETGFGDARYVAIGWSLCLTANFVQRPLATFIPKFSAQAGHSAWMAGALLCALMWSQVLGGYVTYRRANWLYTARPIVVLQIGTALALCGLWMSRSYAMSLMAMVFLGVLHGFAFFCAVFYCSNSLRSAHNVGINEMSVSVGNIGGMIGCNAAIRWMGSDLAFYPATIAFSLLMLGAQMWWLRGARVVVPSSKETATAI